MHRRVAAYALSLTGLVVTLGGFARYAANGLPYQDATPEMLARQATEGEFWGMVTLAGLQLTLAGVAWIWRRRHNDDPPEQA